MYTCESCGKKFELPVLVDTGGEYGGTAHKEPASPCCNDSFEEFRQQPVPCSFSKTIKEIENLMERWHLARDNDTETLQGINDALLKIGLLEWFNRK